MDKNIIEKRWVLCRHKEKIDGIYNDTYEYSVTSNKVNTIFSSFEEAKQAMRDHIQLLTKDGAPFDIQDGQIISLNKRVKDVLCAEGKECLLEQIKTVLSKICVDVNYPTHKDCIPTLSYKSGDEMLQVFISDKKITILDYSERVDDLEALRIETNIHAMDDPKETYYFLLIDNPDDVLQKVVIDFELHCF